ncbi:MAG: chemotaxis protein CheA [Deltaproteobacteria bacterium]|nr:chemotaxis protein CheA [Deltaproteobacteria bacterium]
MGTDHMQDDQLLTEFITESRYFLETVEPDLSGLAGGSSSQVGPEVYKRMFRTVNVIKTSAVFLNFNDIIKIGQALEKALFSLQEGRLETGPALTRALLDGFALIKQFIESPHRLQAGAVTRLVTDLETAISPGIVVSEASSRVIETLDQAASHEIKASEAASDDKNLYASIQSIGEHPPSPPGDQEKLNPCFDLEPPMAPKPHIISGGDQKISPAVSLPRDQGVTSPAPEYGLVSIAPEAGGKKFRREAIPETIRVQVPLIDEMMSLTGELVSGRNQLRRIIASALDQTPGLNSVLQLMDLVTTNLQEQILQLRMQPVTDVLSKFPRIVRDLSRQLAKNVELIIKGAEVELDKSVIEALSDPLTHLIRNSLDHGLESPAERLAAGKNAMARITIAASQEEGQVDIAVSDDGRGIDIQQIVRKAVTSGLVSSTAVEKMTETQKLNLITLPGFSTAEAITDLSGRGVGMDVVRTNIEHIGGRLEIDTVLKQGTTVHLRLPLTLAIIPSLLARVGKQTYAIPQMDIQELVCLQARDISQKVEMLSDAPVLRLRGRLLPLVRLADLLELPAHYVDYRNESLVMNRRAKLVDRRMRKTIDSKDDEAGNPQWCRNNADRRRLRSGDTFIVVLRFGHNRYGLVVDELLDTEEIVVKPLSSHLKKCRWYSGAAILGDGKVALILNSTGIAELARLNYSELDAEEQRQKESSGSENVEPSRRILIFNNSRSEFFAVPLTDVSRVEKVLRPDIGRIGLYEYVNYHGVGLPVIRLENYLKVHAIGYRRSVLLGPQDGEFQGRDFGFHHRGYRGSIGSRSTRASQTPWSDRFHADRWPYDLVPGCS